MPTAIKVIKLPGTGQWRVEFEGVSMFRRTSALQTVDPIYSLDQSSEAGQI